MSALFQQNGEQSPSSASAGKTPFLEKPLDQPVLGTELKARLMNNPPVAPEPMEPSEGSFFKANKYYILAIVVGLLVIGVLSFFAFRTKPTTQAAAKIELTVDAPDQVPSGTEVVYKVKVDNKDTERIVGMKLELTYPTGYTFVSSSPKPDNLSGSVFSVPDLVPGQNAVVVIKARSSGSVGEQGTMTAKLHYRYGNFSSDFISEASHTETLTAASVSLDITGPSSTSAGQVVTYSIHYQNGSEEALKGVRVSVVYPPGFAVAQGVPTPSLGNSVWNVGDLQADSGGDITINGSYTGAAEGSARTVTAELQTLGANGSYFTQARGETATSLQSQPLVATLSLDRSGEQRSTADPGETLRFNVKYQNNASVVARGVNVVVTLDPKALDLSTVQAEGARVSGGVMTWNASSLSQLEALSPGDSGNVNFSVKVKDPVTKDSSENITVVSSVRVTSAEYSAPLVGNEIKLKVTSPSVVSVSLQQVSGELPPQVGKETTYELTFRVTNSSNSFTGALVTAFVPLGVGGYVDGSVTPSLEAGRTTYDKATGKLTWRLGSVPAHAGSFTAARQMAFRVRVVPSAADVGRSVMLLKTLKYQASDLFTGENINGDADDVTTASLSGENNQGSGQVRP